VLFGVFIILQCPQSQEALNVDLLFELEGSIEPTC